MYSLDQISKLLPGVIKLERDYSVETHRSASVKLQTGQWKEVGQIPDYSLNQEGTMKVLERVPLPEPPKPKPVPLSQKAPIIKPPSSSPKPPALEGAVQNPTPTPPKKPSGFFSKPKKDS